MKNSLLFWKFSLVVCCLAVSSIHARAQRLDGDFWTETTALSSARLAKATFALGLLVGLGTAPELIVINDASGQSLAAMKVYLSKHLQSMPTEQLVAGLDSFYADYANKRILVRDAAAVVLRRIVGDDDSQINDWVKQLRANAAR